MAGTSKAPPVPKPVQLFVNRLNSTMQAQRLYPSGSDMPRRNCLDSLEALTAAMGDQPYLELWVDRAGLHLEDGSVFPNADAFRTFAREFYKRNLAAVRFHREVTPDEIHMFLSLIISPFEEVAEDGGVEAGLSKLGVTNITVSEAATRIVEVLLPGAVVEPPAEAGIDETELDEDESMSIEQILEQAGEDQERDHRLLMRALRDARIVADYLRAARARGPEETSKEVARRIGLLVRAARNETPEERSAVLSTIAKAIVELSSRERGELYLDHLIEHARHDRTLAELIKKLSVEELVDRSLEQTDETQEALTALSRAVRNMTLMGVQAPGAGVLDFVVSKLQSSGASNEFIAALTSAASPAGIMDIEQLAGAGSEPTGAMSRLMDMTRDGGDALAFDEALEPLRAETARGTTDGDVIESLVSVAMLEARDEQFEVVMSMLEDSVGYLIEAQGVDVATDVAEAMSSAARDETLPDSHRARMNQILQSIARPDSLAAVASVLRRHKSDSPEYAACKRLLTVLGESMILPLLAALADENDMSARRVLIETISANAGNHIPELGAQLIDQRWYYVRNVVSILAATHSPEALVHLQRTLRHGDARVRRETIRGLASIRTAMSDSMLMAGLDDADAQNVQVAANYLGSLKCVSAVAALELVARGQNRGSHDQAARVAAIEALSRIGEPSSVAVFRECSQKRGFLWFGAGQDKELRAAALAALGAAQSAPETKGTAS